MPISKTRESGRSAPARSGGMTTIRAVALAALLVAAAALAHRPAPAGAGLTPTAAAQQASPTPSKEYIYAGGRLVATEEPAAAQATPTPTPTPPPAPPPTPTLPPGQEPVLWTNMVGVSASPTSNSLTKTAGGGWDAGAVSTRAVFPGGGSVEFTADSYAARMCGLSYGDSGQSFADIDFAIHPNGGGLIDIWEKGVFVTGGVHSYQPGDRFRVSVESSQVRYYKVSGGAMTLIHASGAAPAYPLQVDTSLYSMVTGVSNVTLSGDIRDLPPPTEDVVWTNAVGVSVSGNTLTRTSGAGWDAGAASAQAIQSGDGHFEFGVSALSVRMAGLANGDSSQSFADIDYAIHPNGGGLIDVWEQGVFVAGGVYSYQAGDRFRVAIESQGAAKYVRYYRIRGGETTLVHEHQTTPAYPLRADTSLYSTGATVEGAVMSGNLSP